MPSILIRELDDATIALLKERARRKNRSLQGEVKTILEEAAMPERKGRAQRRRRPLSIHFVNLPTRATYSRDEIYGDDGR